MADHNKILAKAEFMARRKRIKKLMDRIQHKMTCAEFYEWRNVADLGHVEELLKQADDFYRG
ncbi:MAG: hypothetical protein GY847_14320 [Proteobacteria bacterium]|nr:hypothetical protein [Pseudomonadota bacterium]